MIGGTATEVKWKHSNTYFCCRGVPWCLYYTHSVPDTDFVYVTCTISRQALKQLRNSLTNFFFRKAQGIVIHLFHHWLVPLVLGWICCWNFRSQSRLKVPHICAIFPQALSMKKLSLNYNTTDAGMLTVQDVRSWKSWKKNTTIVHEFLRFKRYPFSRHDFWKLNMKTVSKCSVCLFYKT